MQLKLFKQLIDTVSRRTGVIQARELGEHFESLEQNHACSAFGFAMRKPQAKEGQTTQRSQPLKKKTQSRHQGITGYKIKPFTLISLHNKPLTEKLLHTTSGLRYRVINKMLFKKLSSLKLLQ